MNYKATNKVNFQKSDKEFQSKTKDIFRQARLYLIILILSKFY